MARRTMTKGSCGFCGRAFTRSGMTKHLAACPKRMEALSAAETSKHKTENLYHLLVQDAWGGDYWLHLEMNGSATLEKLDSYLRAIWLECCGHLSEFYYGKKYGSEMGMQQKIDQVFEPGVELFHIYDFGTSSETRVSCVAVRKGSPLTKHPIALMARNDLPGAACMECDEPAKWLCIECIQEHDESGLLCDEHAEEHPHDNYGEPMPLANSPRVGMCGYDGPAEPPY